MTSATPLLVARPPMPGTLTPTFQHLFLTRFNIRDRAAGWSPSRSPEWMDARMRLFETYCLPTVQAQTCTGFRWRILVAEDTEDVHLERLRAHDDRIELVPFTPSAGTSITSVVQDHDDVQVLITSRLDNDDGIHRDYVRRVQERVHWCTPDQTRVVHSFPWGYKLTSHDGRLHRTRLVNSAFTSMFEWLPAVSPVSVWARNHSHLPMLFPTVLDESIHGFLQVVHGENVLNSLKATDLPAPFSDLAGSFYLRA